jgi:hypothetical protein
MPGKINPEIKIELGGKERTLRFDLNAMAAYEEATGKSLFNQKDAGEISGKMSAVTLRALLWAMLLHEEKTIALEDVGGWITTRNMAAVAGNIGEAFNAAMPEPSAEDKQCIPLAASL